MMNTLTDVISQRVKTLTESAASEVLNFIDFVEYKQQHFTMSPPGNNAEILKFLQDLPTGTRDVADINRELRVLRNEWGQP